MVEAKEENKLTEQISEKSLRLVFDDKEFLSRYFALQMEKGGKSENARLSQKPNSEFVDTVRKEITTRLEKTPEGQKYLAGLRAAQPETSSLTVTDDLTNRYFHLENTNKLVSDDPESSLNRSRRLVESTHNAVVQLLLASLPESRRSSPEMRMLAERKAIEKMTKTKRANSLGLMLEAASSFQVEQNVEKSLNAEQKKQESIFHHFMVWLNKRNLVTDVAEFKKLASA